MTTEKKVELSRDLVGRLIGYLIARIEAGDQWARDILRQLREESHY